MCSKPRQLLVRSEDWVLLPILLAANMQADKNLLRNTELDMEPERHLCQEAHSTIYY